MQQLHLHFLSIQHLSALSHFFPMWKHGFLRRAHLAKYDWPDNLVNSEILFFKFNESQAYKLVSCWKVQQEACRQKGNEIIALLYAYSRHIMKILGAVALLWNQQMHKNLDGICNEAGNSVLYSNKHENFFQTSLKTFALTAAVVKRQQRSGTRHPLEKVCNKFNLDDLSHFHFLQGH